MYDIDLRYLDDIGIWVYFSTFGFAMVYVLVLVVFSNEDPPVIPKWQSAHVPCVDIGRVRQMGWPLCHCHCLGNPGQTEPVRLTVCMCHLKQVELLLLVGKCVEVRGLFRAYHQFSANRNPFPIRQIEGQPPIDQPVYRIDMLIIDT